MNSFIRIIGGKYRGKKIPVPDLQDLRPTPDRVRETLFNWLMHDIRNKCCLDAFAGSGALGFEALSRGAKSVTLVEKQSHAYKNLVKTASDISNARLHVINQDINTFIKRTQNTFDIIFLDPPFTNFDIDNVLKDILENKILVDNGLLYIESPHTFKLIDKQWLQIKSKKAGKVYFGLYKNLGKTNGK